MIHSGSRPLGFRIKWFCQPDMMTLSFNVWGASCLPVLLMGTSKKASPFTAQSMPSGGVFEWMSSEEPTGSRRKKCLTAVKSSTHESRGIWTRRHRGEGGTAMREATWFPIFFQVGKV